MLGAFEGRRGVAAGQWVPYFSLFRVLLGVQRSGKCAVRQVGEGSDVEEGEEDHLEARKEGGETDHDLVGGPVLAVLDHADSDEEAERCDRACVSGSGGKDGRIRGKLARLLPEREEYNRFDA